MATAAKEFCLFEVYLVGASVNLLRAACDSWCLASLLYILLLSYVNTRWILALASAQDATLPLVIPCPAHSLR
jgi:hypothetical protein